MAKILASRNEPSVRDVHLDLIDLGDEALGHESDSGINDEDDQGVVNRLVDTVIELAARIDHLETMNTMLNMDVLALMMNNNLLRNDLGTAVRILSALNSHPHDGAHAFQHAYAAFTSTSVASFDQMNGALEITFRENDLREALKAGIADYINEVAQSALA